MSFTKLVDVDVSNKRVLIRVDMNAPIKNGQITDDTRIKASIPTVQYCLNQGAAVILMTHLGRPKEGQDNAEFDVRPVAKWLGDLLAMDIAVIDDWQNNGVNIAPHQVVMLQNVRLNSGEKANDQALGQAYAALCDVYVNDAFGTAHRAQASTHAVAQFAPVACAGLLLSSELESLAQVLKEPQRPLIAIVAGSKVSTKLTVLENLADKVDGLIVGGGIANTFLLAQGVNIGLSLAEADLIDDAKRIIRKIEAKGGSVPLPTDVYVAKEFSEQAEAFIKQVSDLDDDDRILDIGPDSARVLEDLIKNAGTIVWNGPVGVFEFEQFSHGTERLAHAIADSNAFSIAGGGDTLAAISKFNVRDKISYVSTGGGSFLEFLEGKTLPAVAILEEK